MPLVQNRTLPHIVNRESTGWERQPDTSEVYKLTTTLSDGTSHLAMKMLTYKTGQREALLEDMIGMNGGAAASAAMRRFQALRDKRSKYEQQAYADSEVWYREHLANQ